MGASWTTCWSMSLSDYHLKKKLLLGEKEYPMLTGTLETVDLCVHPSSHWGCHFADRNLFDRYVDGRHHPFPLFSSIACSVAIFGLGPSLVSAFPLVLCLDFGPHLRYLLGRLKVWETWATQTPELSLWGTPTLSVQSTHLHPTLSRMVAWNLVAGWLPRLHETGQAPIWAANRAPVQQKVVPASDRCTGDPAPANTLSETPYYP